MGSDPYRNGEAPATLQDEVDRLGQELECFRAEQVRIIRLLRLRRLFLCVLFVVVELSVVLSVMLNFEARHVQHELHYLRMVEGRQDAQLKGLTAELYGLRRAGIMDFKRWTEQVYCSCGVEPRP